MAKKKDIPLEVDENTNDITSDENTNDISTKSEEKSNNWLELGAFWLSKSGKSYNGKLSDGTKVVLMKNIYKKEEKHPDFRLFALPDSE